MPPPFIYLLGPNPIGGGRVDAWVRDDDEQLHCLPLYLPCATEAELEASVADGGIEILNKFKKKVDQYLRKKIFSMQYFWESILSLNSRLNKEFR